MAGNNKEKTIRMTFLASLGLYKNKPFTDIENIWASDATASFLTVNSCYFFAGCSNIAPPSIFDSYKFPGEYLPVDHGRILYLIEEGQIPNEIAKEYLATYSLDGMYGRLADLGYLCVLNVHKLEKNLLTKNPNILKQTKLILRRDRLIIQLLNIALDAQQDLANSAYAGKIVSKSFSLINEVRDMPLDLEIPLNPKLLDRKQKLIDCEGNEAKYADFVLTEQTKTAQFVEAHKFYRTPPKHKKPSPFGNNTIDVSVRR